MLFFWQVCKSKLMNPKKQLLNQNQHKDEPASARIK